MRTTLTDDDIAKLAATFGTKPATWHGACPDCQGTGIRHWRGEMREGKCWGCDGQAMLIIDPDAIRSACANSRTGKFRASSPKAWPVFGARYVWRMTRFHAGIDLSMPMMVLLEYPHALTVPGSPLNDVADYVAWDFFGPRSLYGTARWAKALGI